MRGPLPLIDRVTVSSFQFAENDCGEDGHRAQHKERPVGAVNELLGIGANDGAY